MAFIAGGLNANGCNGETPCNCYPISDTTTECVTDRGHRYINDGGYDSVNQNEQALEMMQIDIAPSQTGTSFFRPALSAVADLFTATIDTMTLIAESILKGAVGLMPTLFDADLRPSYFGGPVYSPVVSILDECEAGGISGCEVVSDPGSAFEGAWKTLEDIF